MSNNKKRYKIQVEGMSCTNCSIGLKNHLEKNGFEDVIVNFSTGETSCIIQKDQSQEKVKKIITKLGYTILSNQDDKISLKLESLNNLGSRLASCLSKVLPQATASAGF